MTRYEQTPVDEVSNLPLLFVPRDEVLPLMNGTEDNSNIIADLNHVYHPRPDPLLQGAAGGMAVRQCRGQFVLRTDHDAYHHNFDGPPLPQTRDERLRAVVLSAAGYIPQEAMDFSHRRPRIVQLQEAQRERLRTSGEVRIITPSAVRGFLEDCVDRADTGHIHQGLVEEFLSVTQPLTKEQSERQRYLAHTLLSLLIEPLVDPLDPAYSFGRNAGLIAPSQPSHPRDFIHQQIVGTGPRAIKRVANRLRAKLAPAFGEAVTPDGLMVPPHVSKGARSGAFLVAAAASGW